jgi:hypothetical protein
MIGEVTSWNSNVDTMVAGRMINNRYRQIVRRRDWYGLKVRGIASVPTVVSTGQVTLTNGSPMVQGMGTGWTTALVGLQFRNSFTSAYQTIVAVNVGLQQLTLDSPWQGQGTTTGGYQIVEAYITFGANIKRFEWAVNQLFGWSMEVNVAVQVINSRDTWRQNLGWATTLATRAPTPDGQFQVECWPTPYAPQTFPFEAWTQPPDMVADTDAPVAWINSDLLVTGGIADALLYRPKQNAYYDVQSAIAIARDKNAQFKSDLLEMENSDEALNQQAVTWSYEDDEGGYGGVGSTWGQMHA